MRRLDDTFNVDGFILALIRRGELRVSRFISANHLQHELGLAALGFELFNLSHTRREP